MDRPIASDVRKFIADNFLFREGSESISDTDSFMELGLIDSTGILELVGFLEKNFSIRIADSEITPSNLDSIAQIVSFISAKTAAAAPAKEAAYAH